MSWSTIRDDGGYTLLELLIVLMLAGLVGAAISGGLQFGTSLWESSERKLALSRRNESAQAILRDVLASAIPRKKDNLVTFSGEPDAIAFDGGPPGAFFGAGLARIELTFARGENGTRLVLKATSLIDPRRSRTATLADGLASLQFAYLDASGKVPVWLAFWRDRDRLPDAVRIEADSRVAASPWSAFVSILPIAQDPGCRFDPVSTSCRGDDHAR